MPLRFTLWQFQYVNALAAEQMPGLDLHPLQRKRAPEGARLDDEIRFRP
jgi:hypothetical protein